VGPIHELSPEDVLRLGAAVHGACKQAELGMPPHGPRRLASSVSSLSYWLLHYLRDAVGTTAHQGGPTPRWAALFARAFRTIHEELLPLLRSPDPASFPTELVLPFRDLLCRIGAYDRKQLSFAMVDDTEFNFGVRSIADLLHGELSKVESSLALQRPAQAQRDVDASPGRIILLTQPSAESRDVLAATSLVHELGHAVDLGRGATHSILTSGGIVLPAGAGRDAYQVTYSWLLECVADLLAARLFGPCAVFALRRLSLLLQTLDEDSPSHPCTRTRLAFMLEHLATMHYLDEGSWQFADLLVSWQEQCLPAFSRVVPKPDLESARFALFGESTRRTVHAAVESLLGRAFFTCRQYNKRVPDMASALRSGVPGVVDAKMFASQQIVATVLNAVWEIAVLHQEQPLDFLHCDSDDSRVIAMGAVHGLALKSIEASYALRKWKGSATAPAPEPILPPDVPTSAVLSEEPIRARLGADLQIVPLLDRGQVSKCAVDLRLGSHFIVTKAGDVTHFSPSDIDEAEIHRLQEPVTKGLGSSFVLHPGRLVLGATLEYIALPKDLAALVLSRSGYGRLGLLVATAVFVHPNWRGCLTLELANYSEVPIELRCGEPVAQLVLLRAEKLASVPGASPRSGLCPIRPQFPRLASREESANLKQFADTLRGA